MCQGFPHWGALRYVSLRDGLLQHSRGLVNSLLPPSDQKEPLWSCPGPHRAVINFLGLAALPELQPESRALVPLLLVIQT